MRRFPILEAEFEQACLRAVGQARGLGYDPTIWMAMVDQVARPRRRGGSS